MDEAVQVNDKRGGREDEPVKEAPTIANESQLPKPKYVVEIGVLDEHLNVSFRAPVPLEVVERVLLSALAFIQKDLAAKHMVNVLGRATARVQPVQVPAGVFPGAAGQPWARGR